MYRKPVVQISPKEQQLKGQRLESLLPSHSISPFPLSEVEISRRNTKLNDLLNKLIGDGNNEIPIIYAFSEIDELENGELFDLGIEFFSFNNTSLVPFRTRTLEGQDLLTRCEELSIFELSQILTINGVSSIYTGRLPKKGSFYGICKEVENGEEYNVTQSLSPSQIEEFESYGIEVIRFGDLPNTTTQKYLH